MPDTFDDNWVPSGLHEDAPGAPGAPDSRGFNASSAVFATGDTRWDGATVTTPAKHPEAMTTHSVAPEPEPAP